MRTLFSTAAAVLALSLILVAQDKAAPKGKGAPPKNLKILTAENFFPAMQGFVAALGLADKGGCNYCHEADRSSDEKIQKVTARNMLQMVRDINANSFGGQQKVTCFTCHHGSTAPLASPPPAPAK